MKSIAIYEPAMCCNTGVCGPSPDKELIRVAADLKRLAESGIEVQRYNLSQQPEAFVQQAEVRKLLQEKGPEVLPITLIDGEVRLTGRYPGEGELAAWSVDDEKEAVAGALTKRESELVALGAAVGSNCIHCIEYHIPEALRAGLMVEEVRAAIQLANKVKRTPANLVLKAAFDLLSANSAARNSEPCCPAKDQNMPEGAKCC